MINTQDEYREFIEKHGNLKLWAWSKENLKKTFINLATYYKINEPVEFVELAIDMPIYDTLLQEVITNQYGVDAVKLHRLYRTITKYQYTIIKGWGNAIQKPYEYVEYLDVDEKVLDFYVYMIQTQGVYPLLTQDDITRLDRGKIPKIMAEHLKEL